jgi:hypothetical protein
MKSINKLYKIFCSYFYSLFIKHIFKKKNQIYVYYSINKYLSRLFFVGTHESFVQIYNLSNVLLTYYGSRNKSVMKENL